MPPIPSFKLVGSSEADSAKLIQKLITRFLNDLLKSPTLSCSEILEGFLRQSDSDISGLKKAAERMKRPEFVHEMPSLEGVAMCDADNDPTYFKKLIDFVTQSEMLKTRLRVQSHNLSLALEAVAGCLTELKDSFKQLDILHQNSTHDKTARQLYSNMANACSNWRIHELTKASHVEDSLSSFYLYQASEFQPLKDLLKERDACFTEYMKTDAKIYVKKEKLWEKNDFNKWELSSADRGLPPATLKADKELAFRKMLPNDTLYVNSLKDRYSFFNLQAKNEASNIMHQDIETELANLQEFSKSEVEFCKWQNEAWALLTKKLAEAREVR